MTQGDKDLLLKDLCARLPYGVQINSTDEIEESGELSMIDTDLQIAYTTNDSWCYHYSSIDNIKPYLFPLSSMTEGQREELSMLIVGVHDIFKSFLIEIEFYHKHHIDYRGLIPMRLAIDATNLNIY